MHTDTYIYAHKHTHSNIEAHTYAHMLRRLLGCGPFRVPFACELDASGPLQHCRSSIIVTVAVASSPSRPADSSCDDGSYPPLIRCMLRHLDLHCPHVLRIHISMSCMDIMCAAFLCGVFYVPLCHIPSCFRGCVMGTRATATLTHSLRATPVFDVRDD